MKECDDTGVDVVYHTGDNVFASYALPRTGKDILVTIWYDNEPKKITLKWKGRRFGK